MTNNPKFDPTTLPCLQRLLYPAHTDVAHTELISQLHEVYRINEVGGADSRRKVAVILLKLGIQPND